MEIVYGPVSSWRLGRSLGVDLICQDDRKVCTFDCIYCSLGETGERTVERRNFVDIDAVEEELKDSVGDVEADVVTISGTGEPTLTKNLGDGIKVAGRVSNLPVAVLTNSSLMWMEEVRDDLSEADIVVGSLDAPNEALFEEINKPHEELSFEKVVEGMKNFSKDFEGKFSLEIMFVPENMEFSSEIAEVAREIDPEEIQINTPLRSCPAKPLMVEELEEVQRDFEGSNYLSVYEAKKEDIEKVVGPEKLKLLKRPKEEN